MRQSHVGQSIDAVVPGPRSFPDITRASDAPAQAHRLRAAGGGRGGVGSGKPQAQPYRPACWEWACARKGVLAWGFPEICTLGTGGWAQRQEMLNKETRGCAHLTLSTLLTAG